MESIRLQDLLQVGMSTHLMKSTPKREETDLKPVGLYKIEAFQDQFEEFDLQEDGEGSDGKEED